MRLVSGYPLQGAGSLSPQSITGCFARLWFFGNLAHSDRHFPSPWRRVAKNEEFITRFWAFGVNPSPPGTSIPKVSLFFAKAIDDFG